MLEDDRTLRDINISLYNKEHAVSKLKLLKADRKELIDKLTSINGEIVVLESICNLFNIPITEDVK